MSLLAGIDFSTRAVDIVTVDEETGRADWTRYPLAGADAFERTRSVADVMPARHSSVYDDWLVVAIEEPMAENPKMRQNIAKLKAIQGAVLTCLPARLLVAPLNPGEWKKAVGLKGNASKQEVADLVAVRSGSFYVEEPFDVTGWEQDACDAYCLALAGGLLVSTTEKT